MNRTLNASMIEHVRARPRSAGLTYSALLVLLTLGLATFALTARHASPPTIAEFAPQAVQQISTESEGSRGGAAGAEAPGSPADEGRDAAAATSAQTIDLPRVRSCVGDPPRQIEDPQSPPCVPYWDGDNGGATYRGVTRDTVRVYAPDYNAIIDEPLAAFFNKRFEFYGRRIVVVPGRGNVCGDAEQRALAAEADEVQGVFATLNHIGCIGYAYYDEMARRKLVSAAHYPGYAEPSLAERSPYIWQYPMGIDEMFANIGEWTCRRLAGRNAEHAGDPLMTQRRRTFGIVYGNPPSFTGFTLRPLEAELRACGVSVDERVQIGLTEGDVDPHREIVNAAVQMKAANVSSILCVCDWFAAGELGAAASGQAYFPEWLLSTYLLNDYNFLLKGFAPWPREQLAHVFGLTFQPRQAVIDREPARWAEVEMGNPSAESENSIYRFWWKKEYYSFLLLASAIQLAGPNLTPHTIKRGLQSATFPNPDHPIRAGRVGFGDGDHGMTEDAAEWWWSNTDPGPYQDEDTGGTICYVDDGLRHGKGRWPSDRAPFFTQPCHAG